MLAQATPLTLRRKELGLVLLIWFIGCLALLWPVLAVGEGGLFYCLDDSYIHLAVAEGIWDGTYGVNPGEPSSPSSSLLWPFLLVPFVATGFGVVGPLWINVACGALTACLLSTGFQRVLPRPGWWGLRVLLVVAMLLASNAWGLAFIGMEHSLQLLLAVAVVHGLLRTIQGASPTRMLALATVVGPWVRYENLAVSLAAWCFLAWTGDWRKALRWGLLSLGGLGLFSAFLVAQGLDWLPSSVRMKAGLSEGDWGFWKALYSHVKLALASGRGTGLAVFSLALLVLSGLRPRLDPVAKLALCLSGAGALHLMFGVYGWFHRYEPYIYGSLGFAILALIPIVLPAFGERTRAQLALAASFLVIAFPYMRSLGRIPDACHNVYEQQYQMHRFAAEFWKRPVAVNDLGYVAYDNDEYVLDLAGLASLEVQRRRLTEPAPAWIEDLTLRHGVDLAMVYKIWFTERPSTWVHVADLTLSRKRVALANKRVAFFATHPGAVPEVREALEAFAGTLPDPGQLRLIGGAQAAD